MNLFEIYNCFARSYTELGRFKGREIKLELDTNHPPINDWPTFKIVKRKVK